MIRICHLSGLALALCVTACERAPSSAGATPEGKTIQTGVASFYGREFAGRQTASGEPLKLDAMTAASRTLPLGTRVQVVNAETGQSAEVRINDRGPYAKGRVLDLTPRAARHVGIDKEDGVAQVSIKATEPVGQDAPQAVAEADAR